MCHTQVCPYVCPGKEMSILLFLSPHSSRALLMLCTLSFDLVLFMQKYKSDRKDWWIEPMMLEKGLCAPNGCHLIIMREVSLGT